MVRSRFLLPLPVPARALALLLLVACDRGDRSAGSSAQSGAPSGGFRGPQTLVLRIPRAGGTARVFLYPRADSIVWRESDAAPPPGTVLGFDDESGTFAYADNKGRPVLLDLRLGTSSVTSRTALTGLTSGSGGAIYGVGANGTVVRMTPSGDWTYKPVQPATSIYPQPDGAILVAAGKGARARLLKLFPPDTRVIDSLALPNVAGAERTQLGDQMYFATDTALLVLRGRTMSWQQSIPIDEPSAAMAATPSGDRVFLLARSRHEIAVVDQYRGITERFQLPGAASDLRIDPFGRYLLARAADSDSIWIVAVGTQHVIGGVRGTWRDDLPAVTYDGSILVASGPDVLAVDGETLRVRSRVRGGADDVWYPFIWDGFRPRAASLDAPVRFDSIQLDTMPPDTTTRPDTSKAAGGEQQPSQQQASGFIVSFAAFLAPDRAQALAGTISVNGQTARVVSSALGGNTVYRVVLGPYATREEAENAGRESGHSYWVYEGMP